MKRVLVTGGTGFIGSHTIAPLLDRGYEVHVSSSARAAPAGMPKEAVFHQANLLDPAAGQRLIEEISPSHVLHLAWIVRPGELITSVENLDWVVASLSLMRAFHESGGSRFVGVGSCYEYDWEYGYCSEALTPTVPNTLYGASKNAFRELAEAFGVQHSLDFSWARVFFLYGPGENPNRLASSVILSLLQGREAKSSHGLQVRDYMHVQDAADGIVILLDSAAVGSYNIASGDALRIRDIVERIGIEIGAPELLKIGALPARANDTPLVVADVTKAAAELGFKPKFDLKSGIEDTVAWWRKQQGGTTTRKKGPLA